MGRLDTRSVASFVHFFFGVFVHFHFGVDNYPLQDCDAIGVPLPLSDEFLQFGVHSRSSSLIRPRAAKSKKVLLPIPIAQIRVG
ncbi:MAG: hypothetical protein FWF12_12740, partial [Betaproteobacteria bacterium]|nr:hypothetical protein [Betaproteobacteria bacterium]